jgi:hypothetical protein
MIPPLSVCTTTGLYCVYYFQSWVDELILPSSVPYSIPRAKTTILPLPPLCSPSPEENPLHKYCSELQLRKHRSIFVLCIVIVRWICPMKPHAILHQRNLLKANSAQVPGSKGVVQEASSHMLCTQRTQDDSNTEHRWLTQHRGMMDTVTKKNKDFLCQWTSEITGPLNRWQTWPETCCHHLRDEHDNIC